MKSWALFRLDRQKWTRQRTSGAAGPALAMGDRLRAASSAWLHLLAFGWLALGVLLMTGHL